MGGGSCAGKWPRSSTRRGARGRTDSRAEAQNRPGADTGGWQSWHRWPTIGVLAGAAAALGIALLARQMLSRHSKTTVTAFQSETGSFSTKALRATAEAKSDAKSRLQVTALGSPEPAG